MSHNECSASKSDSIQDDISHRELRAALVTIVAGQVDAARTTIKMRDKEIFTMRIARSKAAGEESPCCLHTI